MKKLLILSGKGGTGKTTVASALIEFSKSSAFADCDVDAPNLHLLQDFKNEPQKRDFIGSEKAVIERDKCINCGICEKYCRFNAIKEDNGKRKVMELSCEGCGVCEYVCKENAVSLKEDVAGKTILYKEDKCFSTARLKMGRGNSGKLVTEVKKNLFMNTDIKKEGIAVIDGSPGIGCPVIASSSGVDMALIVAEPSLSGISDIKRIIKVLKGFRVKIFVCVNKADLSEEKTKEIISLCAEQEIDYLGKIPYDSAVVKAVNEKRTIAGIKSPASDAIYEIYKKIINYKGEK